MTRAGIEPTAAAPSQPTRLDVSRSLKFLPITLVNTVGMFVHIITRRYCVRLSWRGCLSLWFACRLQTRGIIINHLSISRSLPLSNSLSLSLSLTLSLSLSVSLSLSLTHTHTLSLSRSLYALSLSFSLSLPLNTPTGFFFQWCRVI